MIISEKVIIKPNNHSVNHYLNMGYDSAKCRKELLVRVEDLTPSSMIKINCKCDKCERIINIRFQDYNKCIHKNNFYVCEKCKFEKIKMTNKEKYGNENYSNVEKRKETMNFLYACDSPLQNDIIKLKKERTCLEKYGFKTASENKKIKKKISDSNIIIFQDDDIKNKIINKRKITCLEKYGEDNYSKTEEYRIKCEETCIKKYGYKHNGSVPEFILKRQKTQLNNSTMDRTDFYIYKRLVSKFTRKYSRILFENWNGNDYYDGELNNFIFKKNSKFYPSIDHKISTYYGFKNNISPEIIANIDNLCITKKMINSKKREKIYEEKLLIKMKFKIINKILDK